jgi:hypothetical protein
MTLSSMDVQTHEVLIYNINSLDYTQADRRTYTPYMMPSNVPSFTFLKIQALAPVAVLVLIFSRR